MRYTSDQVDFLRVACQFLAIGSLTRAFNAVYDLQCSTTQIRSTLKRYGIRSGRVPKMFADQRLLRVWTPEQADFMRNNYAGRSLADLTALFNQKFDDRRTMQQVKTFLKNRGITSGRTGRYEPGHRPHNKGAKGWLAGGDSTKTQFKPGSRGSKWVPIGSERVTRDGTRQRKIADTNYAPRNWRSVHELAWEAHHGPIPRGHIVVCGAGDPEDVDNLECITRAENMRRNSIHNLPDELADVIRIRGVLNRRINERADK